VPSLLSRPDFTPPGGSYYHSNALLLSIPSLLHGETKHDFLLTFFRARDSPVLFIHNLAVGVLRSLSLRLSWNSAMKSESPPAATVRVRCLSRLYVPVASRSPSLLHTTSSKNRSVFAPACILRFFRVLISFRLSSCITCFSLITFHRPANLHHRIPCMILTWLSGGGPFYSVLFGLKYLYFTPPPHTPPADNRLRNRSALRFEEYVLISTTPFGRRSRNVGPFSPDPALHGVVKLCQLPAS